jgi:SAM-dependent methyltransferase
MIRYIPHPVSEGLARENAVHEEHVGNVTADEIRAAQPSRETFCADYLAGAEGQQLLAALAAVPVGARVLDVGAGYGTIAICLAAHGYRVTAAEPSPALCRRIEKLQEVYELPFDICNVTGEYLHELPEWDFDVCMFNASLHHCDEPLRALANCFELLRPGGRLLLMNEPLLQGFRSKAWFSRSREEGKWITGDYGGNEHIYYYREYHSMLRQAGFDHIEDVIAYRYRHPGSYLRYLKSVNASPLALLVRQAHYRSIAGCFRLGIFGKPVLGALKRLSLLQTNFLAVKKAA